MPRSRIRENARAIDFASEACVPANTASGNAAHSKKNSVCSTAGLIPSNVR